MQIKVEHAIGVGITAGLMFASGVAYGAGVLSGAETIFACLISTILGFMPVATLFRKPVPRDLGTRVPADPLQH